MREGHETLESLAPQRAVWRRRPEDPRTVAGYLVRNESRLPVRVRRNLWRASLAWVLAIGLATALSGPFVGLFVGLLGLAGLMVYARPGAREHAALPTLGEDAAFPVTLEVRRKGRRLGWENGWITFVDGWLVYEGMRTSFALKPDSLKRGGTVAANSLLRLHLTDGTTIRLMRLSDFMQTQRPAGWRDGRHMRDAFRAWREGDVPKGEAVFPPAERSSRVLAEAMSASFTLTALLMTLGFVLVLSQEWRAVGMMLVLAIASLGWSGHEFHRLRKTLQTPTPILEASQSEAKAPGSL